MSARSSRAVDVALVAGSALCLALLIATLRMMLVHIVSGLLFMGVAAYCLLCGQEAPSRRAQLGWFVCTGATLFLFSYWALQVVFRAPNVPTTVGCGGVKFVDARGGAEALRTEL